MINLLLNKLKLIAKRGIVKDLFKKKIKEIKNDFKTKSKLKHGFSNLKINEFIKSLYNIKIQKNLFATKIKGTQKSIYNLKKYRDYDDTKYQWNLFSIFDEDYYKPIKTKSAFNNNYIEYESKAVKDNNLSPKEYLDIIRPYLRDMINDHKTRRKWKIQLTMQFSFISHKDSEETLTMYTKSRNTEIMKGNETRWSYQKTFWISFTKSSNKFRRTNEKKRVCSW